MRTILSMILSLTVLFTTIPSANALVGIAISNRTVKSIGGIMGVAGAGSLATGMLATVAFGNSVAFLALSVLGASTGIIGVVILDEKTADLKFSPLSLEKAQLLGVSQEDATIFNSEFEELNLLKGEVESKITDKTTDQEIIDFWKENQKYLSQETLVVASRVIAASIQLKK